MRLAALGILGVLAGCARDPAPTTEAPAAAGPPATPAPEGADVLGVAASGSEGAYTFSVTIKSPDTGCEQYADWWEVVFEDGSLAYRRILAHSHSTEQPFTRSGGPVPVEATERIVVRAHMSNSGYDGRALTGSVTAGFQPFEAAGGFAPDLETEPPLPEGCAF